MRDTIELLFSFCTFGVTQHLGFETRRFQASLLTKRKKKRKIKDLSLFPFISVAAIAVLRFRLRNRIFDYAAN